MKCVPCLIILLLSASLAAAQIEDYNGFPKNVGASIQAGIAVTNGSQKDIIVVPENREIYVFAPDGTLRWKNVSGQLRSDYGRTPAVSDINGDGMQEIITYANPGVHYAHLYIWDRDGNLMKDILVGQDMILSPPTVADAGEKIILVGASPGNPPPLSGATGVYAYNSSGGLLWYLDTGPVARTAQIAVGNIDDEAKDEAAVIVNNNETGRLTVLKLDITGASVLWTKDFGTKISGAAIDDVNNDSKNEIIIGSGEGVYVFNGNGSLVWSNNIPVVTHSSPAIGDIDGDGTKDVVIGSDQQKLLFAISGGSMMPGFPVSTVQSVWSKPALQDINGDGRPEIIAGDYGGYLYGWDYRGNILHGFPIRPASSAFMSGPVVSDLAGTGRFQIIAGNDNGNIYVYTYNSTYDTSPPTTTDNVDGLWHNSDVTVTLTAEDAGSGVAATYYTTDGSVPSTASQSGNIIIFTGEGVYTLRYFSVDNAGNTEAVRTSSNQVRIDRTPPVTADDADGAWHNSSVTVRLTPGDSGSGVANIFYTVDDSTQMTGSANGTDIVINSEGIHTIKYFGVDRAGNAETQKTATVKLDRTAPVTTDNADGAWHNSSVTVMLAASDTLSGVNSTYYAVAKPTLIGSLISWLGRVLGLFAFSQGNAAAINEEGVFDVHYYSIDNVGNIEPEKVSKEVRIDKTQPVITVTSPENKTYLHSDMITLSFTATDALSGIKTANAAIDGSTVPDKQVLDMLSLGFGAHEFTIAAEDNAGNSNSQRVGFTVIATIDSLIALNDRALSSGWINDSSIANSLMAKLNSARQSIEAGQNATAQNVLEAYINDVRAQSGNHITADGATVLTAEARYVIDHLQGLNNAKSSQVDAKDKRGERL